MTTTTTNIANEIIETLIANANNFFVADNDNDTATEDLVHSTLDDIEYGSHTFDMELLNYVAEKNCYDTPEEMACSYLEGVVFNDLAREISVMI